MAESHSWQKRLALLSVSMLVSFAMAELAVRLLTKVDPRFYNDADTQLHITPDTDNPKDNPFQLPMGYHTTRTSTDAKHVGFATHFNSHGMRDPAEYSFAKPANTRRVMLLGDSVIFGHVDEPQRLPPALRRALEKRLPGQKVETPAFSCPGWDFVSYLLMMQQAVSKFEVDDVVVGVVLNDLTGGSAPITADGKIDLERLRQPPEPTVSLNAAARAVARHSALITALVWASKGFYARSRTLEPTLAKLTEGEHAFDSEVAALESGFAWLAKTCRDRGIRCLVVSFPYGPQLEEALARQVIESWFGKTYAPSVVNDGPQKALAALCSKVGLEFLDFVPIYRAAGDVASLFFDTPEGRIDYVHLSARGNEVSAEAIADRLVAPPPVLPSAATATVSP